MTGTQPSPRQMVLVGQGFDRTAALFDRSVYTDDILAMQIPAGRLGVEGLLQGIFDAAEIPLARYVFLKEQGEPLTSIPVFPDRLFTHQYAYVRTDSDINSPADLRGKRVLVSGYFITASFWHRALLEDEYGIKPQEIKWHSLAPERDPRIQMPEGVEVTVTPSGHLGLQALINGDVDCLMHEATPPCPPGGEGKYRRLFPNVQALQRDYYKKTGFNPMVHMIVVRQSAIEAWPEFGYELCRIYDLAKAKAYRVLQNERMTSLPLMRGYLDETIEIFGGDPWPYGVEANKKELEKFLDLTLHQGYTRRRLSLDELFDKRALDYQYQSKLAEGAFPGDGSYPEANV
jgi:4,5-dihydroxyphthalate decarboxylase